MKLEDLKQLEQAATPGEWGIAVWGGALLVAPVRNTNHFVCELGAGSEDAQRDAALIVAARNALPALLRVVEAARRLAQWRNERGSITAGVVIGGHAWDELAAALAELEVVAP